MTPFHPTRRFLTSMRGSGSVSGIRIVLAVLALILAAAARGENQAASPVDSNSKTPSKAAAQVVPGATNVAAVLPGRDKPSGHASNGAPGLATGAEIFQTANLAPPPATQKADFEEKELTRVYMTKVETGRLLRRERNTKQAAQALIEVLQSHAPTEPKRAALLELGLVAQDEGNLSRAQHLFTQFVQQYTTDPAVPEVFLRQGLIYRQMGINNLAVAKFYNVMNSALVMKLNQFDYYRRMVLQAMTEIADTYYLQGNYTNAVDFFQRVLKQDSPDLNRLQIRFKLLRSLAATGKDPEAVAVAESFIKEHAEAPEIAEVRFLLASSLKQLGRNREAMRQVLELLDSQQSQASRNPEAWAYWQQRAGNDIANQLYEEGDYLNALEIYINLAGMNTSPGWQLPVWYQIGLVCERLRQPMKAAEHYQQIVARSHELATNAPPGLKAVVEMARWRSEFLGWQTSTEAKMRQLQPHLSTNAPSVTASASP